MYRVEDKFSCSEVEMLLLKTRLQNVLEKDTNQKNKGDLQGFFGAVSLGKNRDGER